ncbi:MAG: hypothetical protein Q7U54_07490 [Bacteroidales bacterium]|nr:hypothetical protein [Bacteroidales bacterium]
MDELIANLLAKNRKYLTITTLLILILLSCKSSDTQNLSQSSSMKDEMIEIKALLDKAMLSDDPIQHFKDALPKVQSYSSVDSAWITNTAIFVKFKKGSPLSWIAEPKSHKP